VDKKNSIIFNPQSNALGIFYLRLHWFAAMCFISCSTFAQPKMTLIEQKHHFGSVKRGEMLAHDFEFRNDGNAPLIINSAEVACSCTTVEFPKQPVAPGQTSLVKVKFNTKTVYGRQDRTVDILSNDPHSPSRVRFKANVSKE
jgi:hypothetical protein